MVNFHSLAFVTLHDFQPANYGPLVSDFIPPVNPELFFRLL